MSLTTGKCDDTASAGSWSADSRVYEMLSRYVDWHEDALAVADAYGRWSSAPEGQKSWRFSAYMAALEQEESSATSYGTAVAELQHLARVPIPHHAMRRSRRRKLG